MLRKVEQKVDEVTKAAGASVPAVDRRASTTDEEFFNMKLSIAHFKARESIQDELRQAQVYVI